MKGETVMMAPASRFLYNARCRDLNQVTNSLNVLKKADLERALVVLRKALEAYPGRVVDEE